MEVFAFWMWTRDKLCADGSTIKAALFFPAELSLWTLFEILRNNPKWSITVSVHVVVWNNMWSHLWASPTASRDGENPVRAKHTGVAALRRHHREMTPQNRFWSEWQSSLMWRAQMRRLSWLWNYHIIRPRPLSATRASEETGSRPSEQNNMKTADDCRYAPTSPLTPSLSFCTHRALLRHQVWPTAPTRATSSPRTHTHTSHRKPEEFEGTLL